MQNASGTPEEEQCQRGECEGRVRKRREHTRNEQKQKYVGTQGRGCDCKRQSAWEGACISFLRAAINKVPKPGGLQQQKLVSQFRKLEVKIKVSAELPPPEGC